MVPKHGYYMTVRLRDLILFVIYIATPLLVPVLVFFSHLTISCTHLSPLFIVLLSIFFRVEFPPQLFY